jgi:uncharacterized protein YndB with AHSA1/START domain
MRNIESSIEIKCNPDRVLQAFTDEKDLKGWWKADKALVNAQPGGIYALAWQMGQPDIKYVTTGIIRFYIPGKELMINNLVYINHERKNILGPMELYITAVKNGDNSTVVHLVQSGYQYGGDWDWYYEVVQQGWPYALELLKNYLE